MCKNSTENRIFWWQIHQINHFPTWLKWKNTDSPMIYFVFGSISLFVCDSEIKKLVCEVENFADSLKHVLPEKLLKFEHVC